MKPPLILLPMLTLLLAPIEQATAFFCAICDGHETPLMEITGSRKSKLSDYVGSDLGKLSDYVGSDLGKSAAEWVRKIREEPRVTDNLGFAEGSTASDGPAAGNYCFILDGMIRNGGSDFTWPTNCGGNGDNHVPDAGSTVTLMGLALAVLAGLRQELKL
jgi:VPDSG-CTERM motif